MAVVKNFHSMLADADKLSTATCAAVRMFDFAGFTSKAKAERQQPAITEVADDRSLYRGSGLHLLGSTKL